MPCTSMREEQSAPERLPAERRAVSRQQTVLFILIILTSLIQRQLYATQAKKKKKEVVPGVTKCFSVVSNVGDATIYG